MSLFQVHFGLELPFWLALPNAQIEVTDGGTRHRFNLSNTVHRMEVGDFFLGGGNLGRRWVDSEHAETVRDILRAENPTMPVTRHASKTFLTHVRDIDVAGADELAELYDLSRDDWYTETLRLTNKIVDSYMFVTADIPSQVGPVTSWDVGYILVSFWDVSDTPATQVGGMQLYVRPEMPAPPTIDEQRQLLFEAALLGEALLPVEDLLHIGAASQITRGRFRNAIVDDVTAFELEVFRQVERRLIERLPAEMVDRLTGQRFDDLSSWLAPLGGPAIKQHQKWSDAKKARTMRHAIVHDGATATEADARFVHQVVGSMLEALRVSI